MDDLANEWEIDELDHWGVDLPDIDTGKAENEAEEDDYDVAGTFRASRKLGTAMSTDWETTV